MEQKVPPVPPDARPPPSARPGRPRSAPPESWCPPPCAFGISTAFTEGGKYVPEDIRFQILNRLFFRSASNASMDCPSTPGAPLIPLHLEPGVPYLLFGDLERLTRCLQLVHAAPPGPRLTERTTATDDPAPSLRPRYRGFTTTTGRSASASRDGTQVPTRTLPTRDTPSRRLLRRQYQDAPSHVPHESRRPGSRHLHAGHRLASRRAPARLIPEHTPSPRFRCHLKELRHVSSESARLPGPHLAPPRAPFPHRSPRRSSANAA